MEVDRLRFREELSLLLAGDWDRLELKLDTDDEDEDVFLLFVTLLLSGLGAFIEDRVFTAILVGGASERLRCRLELRDELLTSEAKLAESESRSSHDPALLDPGLGLRLPDTLLGGWSLAFSGWLLVVEDEVVGAAGRLGSTTPTPSPAFPRSDVLG